MKKIVALVLSLVMVLGLATTAMAADVPLWVTNGASSGFDVFDGNNVKANDKTVPVMVKYTAPEAPAETNGFLGNIAYYNLDLADGVNAIALAQGGSVDEATCFVLVAAYEKGCIALKAHNPKLDKGATWSDADSQSAPNAVYFLKPVAAVHYNADGVKFADWGTTCGTIGKPADFDKTATYARVTQTRGEAKLDFITKLGAGVESGATSATMLNILVDGVIYTATWGNDVEDLILKHKWVASEYDQKTGAVTKYTCSVCKVVGTVVASPFMAPADAEVEQLGNLTYVYFYANSASTGSTVESAQTFDAGIAMYVGMSVMAAAGSAVVLKKKD